MTVLSIPNIRTFMSCLFIKDIFDPWLVSEIAITTHNTFYIDGKLNRDFFTEEELSGLKGQSNTEWKLLRPLCFGMIRGNKTPLGMKLVFCLSKEDIGKITSDSGSFVDPGNVNGLFINIKYEHGRLLVTTGTSLAGFLPDRSLEEALSAHVRTFLTKNGIEYDEEF